MAPRWFSIRSASPMLRTLLLIVAVLLIAAGLLVAVLGGGFRALGALLFGIVLLLGIVFERWRYRAEPPPDARWQKSSERFTDPHTGQVIDVFYDPQSGERHYVDGEGRPYR